MPGFVYDTGALIAAERRSPRMFDLHTVLLARGHQPVVPVVVLAQAWRGSSHPLMSRVLKGCVVVPDDEWVGKSAGALLAASGTSDVVDAIVVVTASIMEATVVTSDPNDLRHLADTMGRKLSIHSL